MFYLTYLLEQSHLTGSTSHSVMWLYLGSDLAIRAARSFYVETHTHSQKPQKHTFSTLFHPPSCSKTSGLAYVGLNAVLAISIIEPHFCWSLRLAGLLRAVQSRRALRGESLLFVFDKLISKVTSMASSRKRKNCYKS